MSGGSIRLRLLAASVVSVGVALAIAGFGLTLLFERHVERRIEDELNNELNQLAAGVVVAADGTVSLPHALSDPRFLTPLSGLYWQIDDLSSGALLRSRSLWDGTLSKPADRPSGSLEEGEMKGPDGRLLVAVKRTIEVSSAGGTVKLMIIVAEDHADVDAARRDFGFDLIPALALLALVLIVATGVQVTVGLLPLERLRRAVSDILGGRTTRLVDGAPREVQPLADEINRLLDAQEKALVRARSRAADLAHGLKTPLQVLSGDVRRLRDRGEGEVADEIDRVAGTIRRHVDRELARARVAAAESAPPSKSNVGEVATRVVAVVKRTPRGERIEFTVAAAPDLTAAVDETDLAEILGNLVENAARFARETVTVRGHASPEGSTIEVVDDGPGIPAGQIPAALKRGGRIDARGEGTGLGLAIVSDLVGAYGGTFQIEDCAPGLKASVYFPNPSKPRAEASA